ncbi:O-methyltransferase [Amycolatopsis magusensis]|uniref:O-methyltransferase YrrM n=1 Tax=Amycolatopsis magusensis TaxID=882444 RepID=A0ABS4Q4G1_9PSEU|nr:O-methyltransferase [Amycolatopsis magusensis]MBP2186561.1 putative O-methyltransferase YrrM [Amycolatopsis magusensis]MDI5979629.1 O-methyltransferase [Amycolatopsis magusensis]
MDQQTWTAVDQYFTSALLPPDPALTATLESSTRGGLPPIAVAPLQGKLLHLLAKLTGAKSILEVGTLGGYSTIWLARALPADGRLITLEYEPKHAAVARANIEAAGLADRVEVRVGAALDTLPELEGPFDLSFIDADKVNNPEYFRWALEYSRPGSVIVVDNVVRGGAVVQADSTDPSVQGVRKLHELIANEPRVDATALQTVGDKGYDGLTIALVTS